MNPFKPTLFTSAALVERLEAHGCHIYEYSESYTPQRISASLHEPLPSLSRSARFALRQWLVDAGPSIQISLQAGLLYWGSSCLYESNLLNQSGFYRSIFSFLSRPPGYWHRYRSPISTANPVILLSTHNNPNYFHWLTQPGFSPLFLQEHFSLRPLTTLAVSHRPRNSLPSFLPGLLDVFATGLSRIHGVSLSSISLSRFAIQEHSSEVVVSPAQLDWLSCRCRDFLPPVSKPWRKLFISRRRSSRRRCLNETSILGVLQPYGFVAVCLEDLCVTDQLRIFSESLVIVGPHGAGFSNLVACSPNAAVVELLPRPASFSHYYAIADVLGLSHGHLLANSADLETDDFTVSPENLLGLLRKMELL